MTSPQYTFYILTLECADGKCQSYYTPIWTTHLRWPVGLFTDLAEQQGFTKLHRDESLIGGYYVNPATGDCLVCVPYGSDPADIYG